MTPLDNWKKAAEDLWSLLDDIDTADDMFKNNSEGYRAFVRKVLEMRFKILNTDGYVLFFPDEEKLYDLLQK